MSAVGPRPMAARRERPGMMRLLSALFLCVSAAGCTSEGSDGDCDGGGASGGWQSGPAATGALLVVVGTDYQTTEVSVVELQSMKVRSAAFLHSGSRVTCSGATLGGDVVLGRTPPGDGSFWLIDRGTGVLSRVSGAGVQQQLPLAKGFVANPQDALVDDAGRLWVSRAQGDAKQSGGAPQGDDLVQVDTETGAIITRVALTKHATVGEAWAWPGRMALAQGQIHVPLASVARDFSAMGLGRVALVDPDTGQVSKLLEAGQSKNCNAVTANGDAVAAVCSGFYKEPDGQRHLWSNVIALPHSATASAQMAAQAADTGQARGFGFDLALAADGRGWVISDGDLQTGTPDALWQFDLKGGKPSQVATASGPFTMTSLWLDRQRQRLWVTDRGATGGDLLVLDISGQGMATLLTVVDSNPGGLRASEIGGL